MDGKEKKYFKDVLVIGDPKSTYPMTLMLFEARGDVETAFKGADVKKKCALKNIRAIIFDDDSYGSHHPVLGSEVLGYIQKSKKPFIIVSSSTKTERVKNALKLGASSYISKPYNEREFIACVNAVANKKVRVSCIGGGTGLFHLLRGLKTIHHSLLTSIVSTSDDGGSSGRLKEAFGVLPPGDVRRSLVALSNAPDFMNQVMQYRFEEGGDLRGHSFGNLLITVLSKLTGSVVDAAKNVADLLYIQGMVVPISNTQTTLCAQFEDGTVIKGESNIDTGTGRDPNLHIEKVWHEPEQQGDIDAYACIMNSDIITIGPGDLFTSVITNLIIPDIKEAIVSTKAKKVYICNLMTKPGETANYNAYQHVKEVIKYLGCDCLDYVVLSSTRLPENKIQEYAKKAQAPVALGNIDKIKELTKATLLLEDVGDAIELVRHDSIKLRNIIQKIIDRTKPRPVKHCFWGQE